jgi:hypothetical protein
MPKNFFLVYNDIRLEKQPKLFNTTTKLFRKQIGVLLQHKNKKISYPVGSKRFHSEPFQMFHVEPIYPTHKVPPLLELLNRDDFPEHDELRFKVLKWMIDERKLKDVDLAVIPKNYFLDVLVLTWLTTNKFMTTLEADLVLLTIKHVELDLLPQNLLAPPVVNYRAFAVSFLFNKFYTAVERVLEVTGLKNSMTVR